MDLISFIRCQLYKKLFPLFTGFSLALMVMPSQASAQPLAECPSQNFSEFLSAFRQQHDIQKQFTKIPLTTSNYKDDYEKATVTEKTEDQIDWPVIATMEQQKSMALIQETTPQPDNSMKVRISISESDAYIMDYTFYRANDCWQLTRIDDLTLN